MTPAEEAEMNQVERLHIRADILKAGVAESLKTSTYCGISFIEEVTVILGEARDCEVRAALLRDTVSQSIDGPAGKTRRTRTSTEPKKSARSKP